METKWEKGRVACDTAVTKMFTTWTGIFSTRENKKEDMFKIILDAQK